MLNRIRQIAALGQALWVDFVSRDFLQSGQLAQFVDEGITGVTSNPTIFQKAITGGGVYDDDIRRLTLAGHGAAEMYEALALADIAAAAECLRPVYNETHGRDGFVSLEVNPHLANDTEGTIAEARRLYGALNRPNVMIKVPGTEAGLPAVTTLIGQGINVNVTLIFAVDFYERVMEAYLEGLRQFRSSGRPLGLVSSVASFFVSRVDTLVDRILDHRIANGEQHLEPLYGLAAVANAKLAYARYRTVFEGPEFTEFRAAGARVQRPLWASTSTKNPKYPPTKYVDPLIGVNTVNTAPLQTIEAIRHHAVPGQTIQDGHDAARHTMEQLVGLKIDMKWVTDVLLEEGLKAFADSHDQLLAAIAARQTELRQPA